MNLHFTAPHSNTQIADQNVFLETNIVMRCIFNLFSANSITAICIPKQIPKNGILLFLA